MNELEILKNSISSWGGSIEINDIAVSVDDIDFTKSQTISLKHSVQPRRVPVDITGTQPSAEPIKIAPKTNSNEFVNGNVYRIFVKSYMTKKATLEFDFMAKWNNDNPMPLVNMVGEVLEQTKGMVKMSLKGEALPIIRCMRCGKTLSNPVSRKYGLGIECIHKVGIVADVDDVDSIAEQLVNIHWVGWIPKSAIKECEEVDDNTISEN